MAGITATLIGALMQFASHETGLPVPDFQPQIVEASQCDLMRLMQGPKAPCVNPDGSHVAMIFIARPSPMVLYVPPFDATDVVQKAILAHELTHFLQSQSPAFVAKAQKEPCWAKTMEPPAYAVNFAYARLMAEDPEQLFHGTLADYVALFADCATVARLREQGQ